MNTKGGLCRNPLDRNFFGNLCHNGVLIIQYGIEIKSLPFAKILYPITIYCIGSNWCGAYCVKTRFVKNLIMDSDLESNAISY